MKTKNDKDGILHIRTTAYQARSGVIIIDWGRDTIPLTEKQASVIAYDIKDFDVERYNKFYNPN